MNNMYRNEKSALRTTAMVATMSILAAREGKSWTLAAPRKACMVVWI
jgi:hypothetical protein